MGDDGLDPDAVEEIARLNEEIKRLRRIGKSFYQAKANLETMNGEELLFEAWADFGDEESPESVTKAIEEHGLGPMDAMSFMAYCAGYRRAAQFFKEL